VVQQREFLEYYPFDGTVEPATSVYLDLEGGYVLRHDLRRIHKGRRYGGARNDARAGMAITYPALSIKPKQFH